ncbi:MAG: hypothetical protein KKD28_03155 [Chloroflexi bacterium]|nr:hypothetical protein [Chloroflexota bacterium]
MRRIILSLTLLIMSLAPAPQASAQDETHTQVEITSHSAGDALQGIITIIGNTVVDGFQSWEITFGYANDTTGTWFFIFESAESVSNDTLTQWDTTTLSDGVYNLRLTVYLEGGRQTHFTVPDLRVRNYSPIETDTPTPTLTPTPYTLTPQATSTPTITASPTKTPIPITPTPLSTNPIEISSNDISNSLLRGTAGVLAAFLLIGLYASVRRTLRQ